MDYEVITDEWDDSHKYSPAPRHRRRIILNMIKKIQFESVLDAGCAQPNLLEFLVMRGKNGYGCDISQKVIEKNRMNLPKCSFEAFDLCKQSYPLDKKFDLVICSEVLEHLSDWKAAISNLSKMSKKYILITVPSGDIRYIDKKVGHLHHFQSTELTEVLSNLGFTTISIKKWGFPVHTLYKIMVNAVSPEKIFQEFSISKYSSKKIFLSQCLNSLFYINDLFSNGEQLFILAKNDTYEV
jgi:SAM-dependent methyltransferase